MTMLTIALTWCVLQVTLVGLLTAGISLGVKRFSPSSSGSVLLTGLVLAAVLAVTAASPWPSWMSPYSARQLTSTESFGAPHAATERDDVEAASSTVEPFAMSADADVSTVSTESPLSATWGAHSFERFLYGFDALPVDPDRKSVV